MTSVMNCAAKEQADDDGKRQHHTD